MVICVLGEYREIPSNYCDFSDSLKSISPSSSLSNSNFLSFFWRLNILFRFFFVIYLSLSDIFCWLICCLFISLDWFSSLFRIRFWIRLFLFVNLSLLFTRHRSSFCFFGLRLFLLNFDKILNKIGSFIGLFGFFVRRFNFRNNLFDRNFYLFFLKESLFIFYCRRISLFRDWPLRFLAFIWIVSLCLFLWFTRLVVIFFHRSFGLELFRFIHDFICNLFTFFPLFLFFGRFLLFFSLGIIFQICLKFNRLLLFWVLTPGIFHFNCLGYLLRKLNFFNLILNFQILNLWQLWSLHLHIAKRFWRLFSILRFV